MRFFVVTLLCTYALHTVAMASSFPAIQIDRYNIEDGLPDSTIYSLQQDSQGYIWVGTPKGLGRYDGHTFDSYNIQASSVPRILSDNAGNIFIDSSRRIWVGSWGEGLYVYDHNLTLLQRFNTSSHEGFNSDLIQTFFEDKDGDMWIGTGGGGAVFIRQDLTSFTAFHTQANRTQQLLHDRVWGFAQLPNDARIWVATGGGLSHINKADGFSVTHTPVIRDVDATASERVRAILVDSTEALWLGYEDGLCRFNLSNNQCKTIAPAMSPTGLGSAITSLEKQADGKLWIGTLNGLFLLDPQTDSFVPLVNEQKLELFQYDDIRDILVTEEGIIWVATRPSGLIKITLSNDGFSAFTHAIDKNEQRVELGRVLALHVDSDDTLWIGTGDALWYQPNVSSSDPSPIRLISHNLGLVTDIISTQDGAFWFAGNNGLFTLNRDTREIQRVTGPFGDDVTVVSLFEDSSGTLWIGTEQRGLFRIRDGEAAAVKIEVDGVPISNYAITSIAEPHSEALLLGVETIGIVIYTNAQLDAYAYRPSAQDGALSNADINQIYHSPGGDIWVATNNKLNLLNEFTNTFRHFDERYGLTNTAVKSVVSDRQQNIWLSTSFGIFRQAQGQASFFHYTAEDGLHGNLFIQNVSAIDSHGNLYFGGQGGFTRIVINTYNGEIRAPEIHTSALAIDNQQLNMLDFSELSELSLADDHREVHVRVSALDFLSTNLFYSSRLVGNTESWSAPQRSPHFVFTGIRPGTYTLEFKAQRDGVWSNKVASIPIIVSPPWWQTWWAITLFLITLASLVHTWNLYRVRSLRRKNIELQDVINERSEQLSLAKMQLFEAEKNASLSSLVTGVAHEMNTPVGVSITALSTLYDSAKNIREDLSNNKLTKKDFENAMLHIEQCAQIAQTNLDRASFLVNKFKMLSIDQHAHEKRTFNLGKFIEETISVMGSALRRQHVNLTIECPSQIEIESYPGAIAQVFTQLVYNSLEHGFDREQGGNITIKAQLQDNLVILDYRDDGKGITEQDIEKIFKPFFTTKRKDGKMGLGLQIVANIVTIRLNGRISCDSNVDKGVHFHIEFPTQQHEHQV